MLQLEALSLRLGTFSLSADLSVKAGSRVALIGPSGAGKSTLLGAIAGFVPAVRGRILWHGIDFAGQAPGQRPLSIIFQDNNLFPHLSVAQNVGLGLRPDLRLSPRQRAEVAQVLERVGLAAFATRKPSDLSGGQQSRVALARVLLRARPILLLDEPFAALGPALRAEMLTLVEDLAGDGGLTVLMVTHDPQDALRLCPETILVDEGHALPPGPTAVLLADPPPALRRYLGK
ncbi:ATP-binding cassette domain-containing protein [Plastorhodobacter daqingensis]|uniref:ATP-binding cassette domain-containing protein n=1 Tax=Plastorhodobacter daqingensis TaxID=1387281 RepID=A0ABW2UDV3_9RHOB